jgi:hypothetical protein
METKVIERFTELQAREKIGHRVHSLIEFAGVPIDTTGEVVDIYEFEEGSFDVVVEWDRPLGHRMRDRFAKGPYEQFLSEESLAFA